MCNDFNIGDLVAYDYSQAVALRPIEKHGIVVAIHDRPYMLPSYEVRWANGTQAPYEGRSLMLMAKGGLQVAGVIEENCNKEKGSE